jgi:hypothetical protein
MLPKLEKPVRVAQEIQMRHHKCEKNNLTCPLNHRSVSFWPPSLWVEETVRWRPILVRCDV